MKLLGLTIGGCAIAFLLGCETVNQRPVDCRETISADGHTRSEKSTKVSEVVHLSRAELAKRDGVLRPFALRETPSIWRSIQNLRAESELLEANRKRLESELREFGRDMEGDADLRKIKAQKLAIDELHDRVYMKLEDAYIAAAKYEATPSSKEYEDLKRKTIADSVLEAEMATQKFNSLRSEK